ncbi:hypothetical protein E4100_07640 [Soehngenia longivitae]|uniref:Uncharacterized protein n=1 Tax=Soehngenia longivitae TaxID=2562294 RepID=A0A4Z0D1Q1_9FIRM|nr:hypothetical protein [Soehngenia longivitae]TFZ39681.1 hypothetical protein E4100_07640 [Soehngenia longivitae]
MDHKIIEENLQQIDSVISSKIIIGEANQIEEIHIVSNGIRNPKQIARDVESVLLANFDYKIDHRKISIAQLDDIDIRKIKPRLKLNGISKETSGNKANVKVSILKADEEFVASKSGINSNRNIERMLAEATVMAVEDSLGINDLFIVEDIRNLMIASVQVVVVLVSSLINGQEIILSGSSVVKNDYYLSVAKATLDSINRFLTK